MDSLRHSHLLRYVGVHLRQELLSIITYSAADMSLTAYLDMLEKRDGDFGNQADGSSFSSLKKFPPCLASALKYLQDYSNGIAYFIPSFIYVAVRSSPDDRSPRIYLSDRTLSRVMSLSEDSGTSSPDAGRASLRDGRETAMGSVFALGRIYLDIAIVYSGRRRKEALAFLDEPEPFTTHVGRMRALAEDLRENMVFVTVKERGTPVVQAKDAADIIKSMTGGSRGQDYPFRSCGIV